MSSVVVGTQLQAGARRRTAATRSCATAASSSRTSPTSSRPDQHLYFYYEVYDPARAPAAQGTPVKVLTSIAFFRGKVRAFETPVVEATELTAPDRKTAVFQFDLPAASLRPASTPARSTSSTMRRGRLRSHGCSCTSAGDRPFPTLGHRESDYDARFTHKKERLMANFDSLPPGTFCWPELATTDQKAGVAFYRALFGWDVERAADGSGLRSIRCSRCAASEVGAAYTHASGGTAAGRSAALELRTSRSKNVDEAAKKAKELGGKVLAPPFDVMDAGRMAVLQDPTGAVFQVWQPNKQHRRARFWASPARSAGPSWRPRHQSGGEVLHAALRLDGEARRRRDADGVHRVQRRRHSRASA